MKQGVDLYKAEKIKVAESLEQFIDKMLADGLLPAFVYQEAARYMTGLTLTLKAFVTQKVIASKQGDKPNVN